VRGVAGTLRSTDYRIASRPSDLETDHQPLRYGEKESKESLPDLARMLAVLCEQFTPETEVLAVEQPFAVPLIDQETGEGLDRDLVGTLDLLKRDADGLVVVDLKTSARKYTDLQVQTGRLRRRVGAREGPAPRRRRPLEAPGTILRRTASVAVACPRRGRTPGVFRKIRFGIGWSSSTSASVWLGSRQAIEGADCQRS
jgi:hypothetical protein